MYDIGICVIPIRTSTRIISEGSFLLDKINGQIVFKVLTNVVHLNQHIEVIIRRFPFHYRANVT